MTAALSYHTMQGEAHALLLTPLGLLPSSSSVILREPSLRRSGCSAELLEKSLAADKEENAVPDFNGLGVAQLGRIPRKRNVG